MTKEDISIIIPLALILTPGILVVIDFLKFLLTGKRLMRPSPTLFLEMVVVLCYPFYFLTVYDLGLPLDCCHATAFFSPEHRLTIYSWIVVCMAAFTYCAFREKLAPPLVEVVVNCLLLIGIAINVAMIKHDLEIFARVGYVPIILLFVTALIRSQKMLLLEMEEKERFNTAHPVTYIAWRLLRLAPWIKFPILLLLCLPLIAILTSVLLLFGQKPDAAIRAFTETYRHGLSKWDYKCDDVACDHGHFLCTVAAKGHKKLVNPLRLGIRNGRFIICNRQLLVANAFEQMIEERFPGVHQIIRRNYNKIGKLIHQYYHVFDNKLVSDLVYLLMKPLEWGFQIALYTFDHKPEDRIEQQYLGISLKPVKK